MDHTIVMNHVFVPASPTEPYPQTELMCECGARLSKTGTDEQLTNIGWYFVGGPSECPAALERLKRELDILRSDRDQAIRRIAELTGECARINAEVKRLETTLQESHHLFCNFHGLRVGDCNCEAIMKGEIKELNGLRNEVERAAAAYARVSELLGCLQPQVPERATRLRALEETLDLWIADDDARMGSGYDTARVLQKIKNLEKPAG